MSRVRVPDGAPKEKAKRPGKERRLVGQAVKTPASHAGNTGSIPVRVTKGANEGPKGGARKRSIKSCEQGRKKSSKKKKKGLAKENKK